MRAITDGEEARHGAAEIDDEEEERRQRIETEMRTEPRQADGQADCSAQQLGYEERARGENQADRRRDEAGAVDHRGRQPAAMKRERCRAGQEKGGGAAEQPCNHHAVFFLSRRPRPPLSLAAPSLMSSMPRRSSAAMTF